MEGDQPVLLVEKTIGDHQDYYVATCLLAQGTTTCCLWLADRVGMPSEVLRPQSPSSGSVLNPHAQAPTPARLRTYFLRTKLRRGEGGGAEYCEYLLTVSG